MVVEDRKLQCPNCSQPMQLQGIQKEAERQTRIVYECKPCGVGITETKDDQGRDRPLW